MDACLSLRVREDRAGSLGPVLNVQSGGSLLVGSLERLGSGGAGPPCLRLLVFHAMMVPTLGL